VLGKLTSLTSSCHHACLLQRLMKAQIHLRLQRHWTKKMAYLCPVAD